MPTCFVIQPFDNGKFDKRYRDVFEPGIRKAGFEPYRVDGDDSVTVPIDSIESGIRQADVCFADISTDNPNVWYELGYAFASKRPVVMVCSEEYRSGAKFPFDIQHRSIVIYKTESQSDFENLKEDISSKIKALSSREEQLAKFAEAEYVSPRDGLTQPEIMLLAVLASDSRGLNSSTPLWSARRDAERAGITGMGFNLACRRLQTKEFLSSVQELDERDGEPYTALGLTERAWDWIDVNEEMFILHRDADDSPPF